MASRYAILLLVLSPFANALPTPGADDAGSGRDAGDDAALALPIQAGTWTGELDGAADPSDVYRFHPPPSSLIRIQVAPLDGTSILWVVLEDPLGRVRVDEVVPTAPFNIPLIAVGEPQGEWSLLISFGGVSPEAVAYRFVVAFEHHPVLIPVESPDPTWRSAAFHTPNGTYGAIDLIWEPPETVHPAQAFVITRVFTLATPLDPCRVSVAVHSQPGPLAQDAAWLDAGSVDLEVSVPATAPKGAGGSAMELPLGGTFQTTLASDVPGRVVGWILADDARTSARLLRSRIAEFWRESDVEGGTSLGAGPLRFARAATRNLTIPDDNSSLLWLDARTTMALESPPRLEMTVPGDDPIVVHGSARTLLPPVVRAGEYQVRLDQAATASQDTVRFGAVHVPFATCDGRFES